MLCGESVVLVLFCAAVAAAYHQHALVHVSDTTKGGPPVEGDSVGAARRAERAVGPADVERGYMMMRGRRWSSGQRTLWAAMGSGEGTLNVLMPIKKKFLNIFLVLNHRRYLGRDHRTGLAPRARGGGGEEQREPPRRAAAPLTV